MQGPVHEYLGMTIDFSRPGTVQFHMKAFIDDLIAETPPELLKGMAASPRGQHQSPEIKFYPHGSGKKGQTTTYATVKDHIISYRHGQDIAISLRELKKRDLTSEEPTRKISSRTDDSKKLEQDGFDMRYQAEIKQFLDRQSGLEENLMKAYALIFGT